jgi:hypothetical protein
MAKTGEADKGKPVAARIDWVVWRLDFDWSAWSVAFPVDWRLEGEKSENSEWVATSRGGV